MNKLTYSFIAIMLIAITPIANSKNLVSESNQIQRVRIDFHTPLGYTRHLLLAFTPDNAASDGIDYGYDALNFDNYPDDMNWIIGGQRYVIQGVGEFNLNKCYPLAMFLSNSGTVGISLNSLENFESEIDIYVYDSLLGTFGSINSQTYSSTLASGDYVNRFYITFTNNIDQINVPNEALSINESNFENIFINYVSNSKELIVDTKNEFFIKEISIYNLNAQEIYKLAVNTDRIKIPLQFVSSNSLIIKLRSSSGALFHKQIMVH